VQPTIAWLRLFAESGFAPDLMFDASFVAPHAFLLRRATERYPDDVLVLFSELIRHKLTLTDRHRQLDHLQTEVKDLQSGKKAAESEVATLNHQAHLLRVERHQQESKSARLTGQTRNLETAYSEQLRNLESSHQHVREEVQHLENAHQNAYQRAREEVRQLENAYQRAREEAVGTGHLVTGLSDTVSGLDRKSDRVMARLAAVESSLPYLGQEIEGILRSRIWRVLARWRRVLARAAHAGRPAISVAIRPRRAASTAQRCRGRRFLRLGLR